MKLMKPIVIAQISKGSGKDSETYWGKTTLMNPWVLFIGDLILGSPPWQVVFVAWGRDQDVVVREMLKRSFVGLTKDSRT